jgi:hypothetical protein
MLNTGNRRSAAFCIVRAAIAGLRLSRDYLPLLSGAGGAEDVRQTIVALVTVRLIYHRVGFPKRVLHIHGFVYVAGSVKVTS